MCVCVCVCVRTMRVHLVLPPPRPHQMVTKEFGQNWGVLSHKKRQKILSTKIKSPQEFHSFVQEKFKFHPIEIIGL